MKPKRNTRRRAREMKFATNLRAAREKAGLSIADAAKQSGVSPRTWSYWEDGERLPPLNKNAITQERVIASLRRTKGTQ